MMPFDFFEHTYKKMAIFITYSYYLWLIHHYSISMVIGEASQFIRKLNLLNSIFNKVKLQKLSGK